LFVLSKLAASSKPSDCSSSDHLLIVWVNVRVIPM
jgi:hypothetical protein